MPIKPVAKKAAAPKKPASPTKPKDGPSGKDGGKRSLVPQLPRKS